MSDKGRSALLGEGNKAYASTPVGGTLQLKRGEKKTLRVIRGQTYIVRVQKYPLGERVIVFNLPTLGETGSELLLGPNAVSVSVNAQGGGIMVRPGAGASQTNGLPVADGQTSPSFPVTGLRDSERYISYYNPNTDPVLVTVLVTYAGDWQNADAPLVTSCCPLARVYFASGGSDVDDEDQELEPAQDFEFTADNDTVHFIQYETLPDEVVNVWVREQFRG